MAQIAPTTVQPLKHGGETSEPRISDGVWVAGAVIAGLAIVITFYVLGLMAVAHLRFLGQVFNV